jgi:hypothetical protein
MTVEATAGCTSTLTLEFFDQSSGILTDPDSVQLDIVYGGVVGETADFAGPFTYSGASLPSSTQVYRTGAGLYAFDWLVPLPADGGVYQACWTCTLGPVGGTSPGIENIVVTPAGPTPPAQGDTGYWTGSIGPYQGVTIPLGAVDGDGIVWALLKVEGWDSPDTSGKVVQRGSDHGGWPSPQYYAPRAITLTVQATANTQALRDLARTKLQQAVPVNDLVPFVYNEPIPKQALVRRQGRIVEKYPTLMDVAFTIVLVAPNPRKYAVTVQTASATTPAPGTGLAPPWTPPITLPPQAPPGRLVVVNGGNFETRPVLTITGPIAAPAIYDATDGQTVSWSGITLMASDSLVVDLDSRTGTLDGMYTPADISSAWFVCQPGSTQLQLVGNPGAGSNLSAAWQNAYI